jgi:acetyl-CoA acetyltransferase
MSDQLAGRNGQVFVVSAARTPIGKFGGAFASTGAVELGATATAAAVARSDQRFETVRPPELAHSRTTRTR